MSISSSGINTLARNADGAALVSSATIRNPLAKAARFLIRTTPKPIAENAIFLIIEKHRIILSARNGQNLLLASDEKRIVIHGERT